MSLIDELGGYDCAKAEYEDPMYEDDEPYTIKATGTRFFKHNLGEELLEYRRQNNIFEVGDLVVFKDPDNALDKKGLGKGEVLKIKDIDFHDYLIFDCSRYGHGQKWFIHATDKEIEVGHRLP